MRPFLNWIWAFIFIGVNLSLTRLGFYPEWVLDPEFAKEPFWWKMVWLDIVSFNIWTKYYIPWTFQNGNVHASGYCYNGLDNKGNHKWDKVIPLDVMRVEFGKTFWEVMDNWHHCTSIWMWRYIYEWNIDPWKPKETNKAMLITFMLSAFWHGFYPTYYLAFFMVNLMFELARMFYKCWILFTWVPPLFKKHCVT